MAESRKNRDRCSFCGRTSDEVELLITGVNGFICNHCVEQAYEIVQDSIGSKKNAASKLNLSDLPKPVDIKAFFRSICDWTR